jgi:pimeloyl-ACP methyl ester carboxylesterase
MRSILATRNRFALIIAASCAALIVAGGVTVAVAQGSASATATTVAHIHWTKCRAPGVGLECAEVQVPLDWDRPDGSKITLAVIRRLASDPERRIGSLFINFGGPSGSVEQVRNGSQPAGVLDAAVQARFDVVGWDVRGADEASRARCFDSDDSAKSFFGDWALPLTTASSWRTVHKMADLARRCFVLSGDLLSHMSTADIVRDLDYLRWLVGDPQLTYLGTSAGTFVGQTYANMFPRRVRAMVLDGVVDAVAFTKGNEAWFANSVGYADRAFEGFLRLCEAAGLARCALAGHGSAAARVKRVLADLRRGSIPAPTAKPPGELTYGDALAAIVVNMSTGPATWPAMAEQFDAAARGDGSDFATTGRVLTSVFSSQVMSPGLAAVELICADSPARLDPAAWPQVIDRLTRVSFSYGPVVGWWRWAPCASWLTHSANRYVGPWDAFTENPILVIGTLFDPNTPFVSAVRTAERLRNAVLLVHDGYSHTSPNDPSACVKRATSAYLVDLVTPPPRTVCPSDHAPFDPDFGKPPP